MQFCGGSAGDRLRSGCDAAHTAADIVSTGSGFTPFIYIVCQDFVCRRVSRRNKVWKSE